MNSSKQAARENVENWMADGGPKCRHTDEYVRDIVDEPMAGDIILWMDEYAKSDFPQAGVLVEACRDEIELRHLHATADYSA